MVGDCFSQSFQYVPEARKREEMVLKPQAVGIDYIWNNLRGRRHCRLKWGLGGQTDLGLESWLFHLERRTVVLVCSAVI